MNPVRGLTAVIALIIVALKILPMKNRKSGLSASAMVCFLNRFVANPKITAPMNMKPAILWSTTLAGAAEIDDNVDSFPQRMAIPGVKHVVYAMIATIAGIVIHQKTGMLCFLKARNTIISPIPPRRATPNSSCIQAVITHNTADRMSLNRCFDGRGVFSESIRRNTQHSIIDAVIM